MSHVSALQGVNAAARLWPVLRAPIEVHESTRDIWSGQGNCFKPTGSAIQSGAPALAMRALNKQNAGLFRWVASLPLLYHNHPAYCCVACCWVHFPMRFPIAILCRQQSVALPASMQAASYHWGHLHRCPDPGRPSTYSFSACSAA